MAHISAKCSDCCFVDVPEAGEHDGYVPGDMGVGGGDYVSFSWCLECGQIQGTWPIGISELESQNDQDQTDEDL